jgi:hypothetical protein
MFWGRWRRGTHKSHLFCEMKRFLALKQVTIGFLEIWLGARIMEVGVTELSMMCFAILLIPLVHEFGYQL